MAGMSKLGFHYADELAWSRPPIDPIPPDVPTLPQRHLETEFTFTFENFFHPYVGKLIEQANRGSVADLLDPAFQASLKESFFATDYNLEHDAHVVVNYHDKEIDVSDGGPYAIYNWELLFHIPFTVAVHLGKNQRFAEAQRWFHYIFDPTCSDTSTPAPQRFWKFVRFRQNTDVQQIADLVRLLSKPDDQCTPGERATKQKVMSGYEEIKRHPFQPHAVARTRTVAYQYSVVMKYLDNLIAWGDSLFRQDTIESINEATQRYVLAASILGPRPQQLPPRGAVPPKTFAMLKQQGLDAMGNALVELESQFPFNDIQPATSGSIASDQSGPLSGIGRTLYFCIPRNDKLLVYWNTVADRLLKIRNCMNIEGVVRQLALFDPPIDPGMLVKATAAGIDIGSVVSGVNQPIGPVRSLLLIQKAQELCGEVRGLGASLLSALEKGDAEHLGLMHQGHEIKIQQMMQDQRFLQWKQAETATEALLRTRASALERYRYYQRLLGLTPDGNAAPDTLALDRRELTEENFDETYGALIGEFDKAVGTLGFPRLKLAGASSPVNQSDAASTGQLNLILNEDAELNKLMPLARDMRLAASVAEIVGSVLTFVPEVNVDLHYWGLGAHSTVAGGSKLSDAAKIAAEVLRTISSVAQDQAGMASRTASYERRSDDWMLQNNLAAHELMQIGRQIITSLIAEKIARHEYKTVKAQIENAQDADRFLHEKFTKEELYMWMQGELSRLYYEYYRFAFDTARRAERTMKQEMMRPELDQTDFVKFNYWDGGRKGLLAGEALQLDVKRMEMAYHDNNKREFEITRHVSLRQLDPLALLQLRIAGRCEFSIPEWLYDYDCPGHYMRRIRNVALSIPSVVGPYTGINCTLSLLRSSIRKSPLSDDPYGRTGIEDDRFVDYFGSVQSIVTSGGTGDSGMFETSLHDERFLPFEGAGAIGTWTLELPETFRAFDYMTISDVILHVRYTARQGGKPLGDKAVAAIDSILQNTAGTELALLFSLRHDFAMEWSAFANGSADSSFGFKLRKEYFPYLVQGRKIAIAGLDLYASNNNVLESKPTAGDAAMNAGLNGADGFFAVSFPSGDVLRRDASDVFLVVRYSLVP